MKPPILRAGIGLWPAARSPPRPGVCNLRTRGRNAAINHDPELSSDDAYPDPRPVHRDGNNHVHDLHVASHASAMTAFSSGILEMSADLKPMQVISR